MATAARTLKGSSWEIINTFSKNWERIPKIGQKTVKISISSNWFQLFSRITPKKKSCKRLDVFTSCWQRPYSDKITFSKKCNLIFNLENFGNPTLYLCYKYLVEPISMKLGTQIENNAINLLAKSNLLRGLHYQDCRIMFVIIIIITQQLYRSNLCSTTFFVYCLKQFKNRILRTK